MIGLHLRTWDLSGATPVELGAVDGINTSAVSGDVIHVRLVPGLDCAVAGGLGLGLVVYDLSSR